MQALFWGGLVLLAGVAGIMAGLVYGRDEELSRESALRDAVWWGGVFLLDFGIELGLLLGA